MSAPTNNDDVASRGILRLSGAGIFSLSPLLNAAPGVAFAIGGTEFAGPVRVAVTSFEVIAFGRSDIDASRDMWLYTFTATALGALDPKTSSSIGNFRSPSLWNAVNEMKVGTTSA